VGLICGLITNKIVTSKYESELAKIEEDNEYFKRLNQNYNPIPVKQTNNDSKKENNVFDEEYIIELMDAFDESELIINPEYDDIPYARYIFFDFDEDGTPECIACDLAKNKARVYETKDGYLNVQSLDLVGGSMDARDLYIVQDNKTEKRKLVYDHAFADGLCFSSRYVSFVEYNDGKITTGKNIMEYSCDQELEDKLRDEIENNPNLTDEEKDEKVSNAEFHRLEYKVEEKKVSEKEFEKYKNNFKEKYSILASTTDEEYGFLYND